MQMYSTSWGSQTGDTRATCGSTKLLSVEPEKHGERQTSANIYIYV